MATTNPTGPLPLAGIRVLEFGGLAPGPFCGVLLADYGADVVRVDRAAEAGRITGDLLCRHKRSIALDLKNPNDIVKFRELSKKADVVIDPFRPGVLERLGLGPEVLMAENSKLVYARLTGFRRDGEYKDMAGHDINYIATSGVLSMLGRAGEAPYAPANIVADFGGGLTCFAGILLALFSRVQTGKGQLVHSSMVDASAYLATFPRMLLKAPMWSAPRGTNTLDGGCPYYGTYETSDGKYMAIGALEPQFYTVLMNGLGLHCDLKTREDKANWPGLKADYERVFKSKTRAEWEAIFDGTDACATPVLTQQELEERGDGNRAAVDLVSTPAIDVDTVEGKGWWAGGLVAGTHDEEVFNEWLGGPVNTVKGLWGKVKGWSKL